MPRFAKGAIQELAIKAVETIDTGTFACGTVSITMTTTERYHFVVAQTGHAHQRRRAASHDVQQVVTA
jgi:hypothetical protein